MILVLKVYCVMKFFTKNREIVIHMINRVFSHDVTAAILISQNNETAAMLVFQTNPQGVELFNLCKRSLLFQ